MHCGNTLTAACLFRYSALGSLLVIAGAGPAAAAEPVDFAHDIVPILRKHCGQCHTGEKRKGGYSMNTRGLLVAGGESGPAALPGTSDTSELIRRITSSDKDEMMPPEGGRVPAAEVAVLKRWIDGGLPWEEGFVFRATAYEPPLLPRHVELPPAQDGRDNPVDRIVDAYFAKHDVTRPQPVADAEFLRRLSLDLVGLLPAQLRLESFLADRRLDKRQRLVRELLADDVAYAEHWLSFWNDLLRNDYAGTGFITGGRKQITVWLYRSLVENKPYHQLVRELIAPAPDSEGFIQGIRWRGTVSASQAQEIQFAQNISQAFLGINMKCASCHDSFIDRWKLSEAYGLAAIYAKEPLDIHRCDKPTGVVAKAAWIFPELGQIDPAAPQPERLRQLALLMTHPDNGRFTRTIVNRLWHRLLGRGIVHPVDAMHTEPWSADLLDFLAVDFAEHGYDLKHTLELIATSQAYQARTPQVTDEGDSDGFVFRGPLARRMTAEQFVDAVWQLTGAAPPRPDALVVRASLKAAAGSAAEPPVKGTWIWSAADAGKAPAGQSITFRRRFALSAAPLRAVAVVTCDNEYQLYINAQLAKADDNWETVEAVALESYLKQGDNEIVIVGKNGGAGPNPAGLFFDALIKTADGKEEHIATNGDWQWTAMRPDGKGRFRREPTDWQAAAEVTEVKVWTSRVGDALRTSLHQAADGQQRMVRASLMKSDFLMRSLGRPNRDQIVSMRPSELTTLEAIDLANGQTHAAAIERGAKTWLPGGGQTPRETINRLYVAALSRQPTTDELAVAAELLGQEPTEEAVQDLLWALLMLPEFQLVR